MVGLEAVAKTMALAAHPTRQPQCGVFEVPFSAVADRKGQSKTWRISLPGALKETKLSP